MSWQMRMVYPYPRGRNSQNPNRVTYKATKEFKLKDFVVEKKKDKVNPCLFEMSLVFACLKENEFDEKMCADEVGKFHNCYMAYYKQEENRKNNKNLTDDMTAKFINKMLKSYKNV